MEFVRFVTFVRFVGFVGFAAVVALGCDLSAQLGNGEFEADMARLVPALGIREGATVADVGAGGGELTFALADVVGRSGRVYSTEIESDRLARIRRSADERGLSQITAIEAGAASTNLPPACCDAIVVRFVYHHFDDPAAMNKSLLASLKPGGRLAVIDFAPSRGRKTAAAPHRDDGGSHGVDANTVVAEVTAAGFERVEVDTQARGFMAVFRKP
jgi:predicted methyltransferase